MAEAATPAATTETITETTQAPDKGAAGSKKPAGDPGSGGAPAVDAGKPEDGDGKKPAADDWRAPIADEKIREYAKKDGELARTMAQRDADSTDGLCSFGLRRTS